MIATHTPDINLVSIRDGWFVKNNDINNKFNVIGGKITDCKLEVYTTKEGLEYEFIKLTLTDTEGTYSLSLPTYREGRTFMIICPNIDLTKVIEIYVSLDRNSRSQIFLKQSNGYLKHYFTKDNPQGLPDFEQNDGKWDTTKQITFLKSVLHKYIIKKVAPPIIEEDVPDFLTNDDFDPFAID